MRRTFPTCSRSTARRPLLLGNLSRDQLDRMNEVAMVARKWRSMLTHTPRPHYCCGHADDPMIVWAAGRPG